MSLQKLHSSLPIASRPFSRPYCTGSPASTQTVLVTKPIYRRRLNFHPCHESTGIPRILHRRFRASKTARYPQANSTGKSPVNPLTLASNIHTLLFLRPNRQISHVLIIRPQPKTQNNARHKGCQKPNRAIEQRHQVYNTRFIEKVSHSHGQHPGN